MGSPALFYAVKNGLLRKSAKEKEKVKKTGKKFLTILD